MSDETKPPITYDEAVQQVRDEAPELTIEPFNENIPMAIVVSKDGRMFSMYKMDMAEFMSQSIKLAKEHFA